MKNNWAILAAFLGGAAAGAMLGLLFAPEKGEDQRKKIMDALAKKGIRLSKEDFNRLVNEITSEIKSIGKKKEVDPQEDFDVE